MKDFLMMFLAFACGGFCGFIAAALLAVSARDQDDTEEFDGGFTATHNNQVPRVRTVIWHNSLEDKY